MIGDQQYADFLTSKAFTAPTCGIPTERSVLHGGMFDFQRDLTAWALRKGRSAIFADTGMGKTIMQLEWARHAGGPALILAPLAVARQTVREAEKWGIEASYCTGQDEIGGDITVTNYERLARFRPEYFDAVVLDESSILKSFDGKTKRAIIEAFADTPMRLCCTATPAPNDIAEIANHAEALGVMTRSSMLATFFVHDDEGWRLKKHARSEFFRWLASWGMHISKPSDLGYPDDGYILPPLTVTPSWVDSDWVPDGQLFPVGLGGNTDRLRVRRGTVDAKVDRAIELATATDEQIIVWCGLNEESERVTAGIPDALEVTGSMSPDEKADRLLGFAAGDYRVLVTKGKIAGFGMNFQNCARQIFVGLSDSYEQYYQQIRRSWRFGQTRPVDISIILTPVEDDILQNVLRKERESNAMKSELIANVAEYERDEVAATAATTDTYTTNDAHGNGWHLMLGDSSERLAEVPDKSIGLSVFSPPFLSLFQYSNSTRDLGNSANPDTFWSHFGWISDHLLRVMMPGRIVAVHVSQVPTLKERDGVIGVSDLRGMTIRHFQDAGFVYHGEITIDKDPQAQAIRTHSKSLLFVQKDKDSSWLRPALADYIVVFRTPGDNEVEVKCDLTNNEWIEWARPIWYGIRETDTLNAAEGRDKDDERHICPLQLGTIERCIRLWTNPGETVLSPFAGIGSEGFQAVKLGRRFVGCELKPSYYDAAVKNLSRAERLTLGDLFAWAAAESDTIEAVNA